MDNINRKEHKGHKGINYGIEEKTIINDKIPSLFVPNQRRLIFSNKVDR